MGGSINMNNVIKDMTDLISAVRHDPHLADILTSSDKTADMLDHSAKIIRATSMRYDREMHNRLWKSADNLNKMADHFRYAPDVHKNYVAISRIYTSWKSIDPKKAYNDPGAYAAEFDNLFSSAGVLAEWLPPPLNSYAAFFKGFETFFQDMERKFNPETRTPHAERLFREINKY